LKSRQQAKKSTGVSGTYPRNEIDTIRQAIIKTARGTRGHYSAGYTNRLREDWPYTSAVPYTDIKPDLPYLIARSRREIDNNGIAAGIRRTIVNNVWGEGPIVQAQIKYKNGEVAKRLNDELEYCWERHSEEMDSSGESNFNLWGKENLENIITSGTSLVNRVPARKDQFLQLTYQMLEPDVLDSSKDNQRITQDMNERAKQTLHGIEIDENYRPVRYWIKGMQNAISADNIRRFYIRSRPNQLVGVPWLTASLPEIFDYRQLKEDHMVKSRILADIALWNRSDGNPFGVQNSDGELEWEPGMIWRSQSKPEIIQAQGDLNATLKPLLTRTLLDACAGTGTSYMAVSRDMEGVNFAASRTNLNEDRTGYKVLRSWLSRTFCQYHWINFVYQCVIEGRVALSPDVFLTDVYRYTRASFQFPAWDWVDPRADAESEISMYQSGLSTLSDSCGKKGRDWRDQIDQRAEELLYMQKVEKEKNLLEGSLVKYFDGIEKGSIDAGTKVAETSTSAE